MTITVDHAAAIVAAIALLVSIVQLFLRVMDRSKQARLTDLDDVRRQLHEARAEIGRLQAHVENCERARTALYAENVDLMRRLFHALGDGQKPASA